MGTVKGKEVVASIYQNSMINPFENEYLVQEIEFYNLPGEYDESPVLVDLCEPRGRLDDYFNKNWRVELSVRVPRMVVNGQLWMSLTPMELQSNWVPIKRAHGKVVIAGLGLGYTALRMAAKPSVESVTVVEIDSGVIGFFEAMFSTRPEFEKITIVRGDARKIVPGYEADFVFVDIYSVMCGDDMLEDIPTFCLEGAYDWEAVHFWGQEQVVLTGVGMGLDVQFTTEELELVIQWQQADDGKLFQMQDLLDDGGYVEDFLTELGRID